MTKVGVEPRPFDQVRLKNDAFTDSDTLPTNNQEHELVNAIVDSSNSNQLIMREQKTAFNNKESIFYPSENKFVLLHFLIMLKTNEAKNLWKYEKFISKTP